MLPAGTLVGSSQMKMRGGILGLQFDRGLERRNGFGGFVCCDERPAVADQRIREAGVELRSFSEVKDSLWVVLVLAGEFAKDVFGPGVIRIDFQFRFEFA